MSLPPLTRMQGPLGGLLFALAVGGVCCAWFVAGYATSARLCAAVQWGGAPMRLTAALLHLWRLKRIRWAMARLNRRLVAYERAYGFPPLRS